MSDRTLPVGHNSIVIVTGPAGAGRTTAIHALEDLGYEAIDNLPMALLDRLMDGAPLERPLAVGIDPRTRGFSALALVDMLERAKNWNRDQAQLLYVDCSADVLLRRFSETRRRHPSARDETPRIGVERELRQLSDLRDHADILIDTSDLSPHDLRARISEWFSADGQSALAVLVQSFAFKRETPRGLEMMMDLRFLRNPHWEPDLRPLNGKDEAVGEYVKQDPLYQPFLSQLVEITSLLLPAYKAEGKSYFSIGLGCTGGQHRSVFVAQVLANALAEKGWQVSIRHRELERVERLGQTGPGTGVD